MDSVLQDLMSVHTKLHIWSQFEWQGNCENISPYISEVNMLFHTHTHTPQLHIKNHYVCERLLGKHFKLSQPTMETVSSDEKSPWHDSTNLNLSQNRISRWPSLWSCPDRTSSLGQSVIIIVLTDDGRSIISNNLSQYATQRYSKHGRGWFTVHGNGPGTVVNAVNSLQDSDISRLFCCSKYWLLIFLSSFPHINSSLGQLQMCTSLRYKGKLRSSTKLWQLISVRDSRHGREWFLARDEGSRSIAEALRPLQESDNVKSSGCST